MDRITLRTPIHVAQDAGHAPVFCGLHTAKTRPGKRSRFGDGVGLAWSVHPLPLSAGKVSPGMVERSKVGELAITRKSSLGAACCFSASARYFRASASFRLYSSSCCSRSARGFRVLAFVPVEGSSRPCIRLFPPLLDKVTSSERSLVCDWAQPNRTAG
jgi:hypothetical protein